MAIPKVCEICNSQDLTSLCKPPACVENHKNDQQACGECWEAHLSMQVEEHPHHVECMFCTATMNMEDLKRLARKGTMGRYKYTVLNTADETGQKCQNRCQGKLSKIQTFDRESDGRVFNCKLCNFSTCVDCDRPEHTNETCEEYSSRHAAIVNGKSGCTQAKEEAASQKYLSAKKLCPSCETPYELVKGCGYTACEGCSFRFCDRCQIPWVGEGSVYLKGKDAHGEGCYYRTRDADSKHGIKRRFKPDDETARRIEEHEEVKRQKREAKEAAKKAAAGDVAAE